VKFVEDNHMVEKLSTAAPDPSFRDPILPGTSAANPLWLDAAGNHQICNVFAKL
jgi:hypothetical protein